MSAAVLEELARLCKPWNAAPLLAALQGEPGLYAVDGTWEPHHMGRPRSGRPAFDEEHFLHGAQALAFLSLRLPEDSSTRPQLAKLYASVKQRLTNPKLPDVGRITAWVHPDCRMKCPELEGIADLDVRLKKNSDRGLWPPASISTKS